MRNRQLLSFIFIRFIGVVAVKKWKRKSLRHQRCSNWLIYFNIFTNWVLYMFVYSCFHFSFRRFLLFFCSLLSLCATYFSQQFIHIQQYNWSKYIVHVYKCTLCINNFYEKKMPVSLWPVCHESNSLNTLKPKNDEEKQNEKRSEKKCHVQLNTKRSKRQRRTRTIEDIRLCLYIHTLSSIYIYHCVMYRTRKQKQKQHHHYKCTQYQKQTALMWNISTTNTCRPCVLLYIKRERAASETM